MMISHAYPTLELLEQMCRSCIIWPQVKSVTEGSLKSKLIQLIQSVLTPMRRIIFNKKATVCHSKRKTLTKTDVIIPGPALWEISALIKWNYCWCFSSGRETTAVLMQTVPVCDYFLQHLVMKWIYIPLDANVMSESWKHVTTAHHLAHFNTLEKTDWISLLVLTGG